MSPHKLSPADVITTEDIDQLDIDLACRALGYQPETATAVLMVPGRVIAQTIRAGRRTVEVGRVAGWVDGPADVTSTLDLARAYLADRYPDQDVSGIVAALIELEAARLEALR